MSIPGRARGQAQAPPRKRASRIAFYAHLWLGVVFTAALLVISATGIMLNHKRGLGLMPDVAHEPTAPFAGALPLDSIASIALAATGRTQGTLREVDRMDVRPRDGYAKVRMRDASSTEVTVDVVTGRVLHIGPRGDAFLEKLHSGEAFGDRWVLLSDAAAIALVITIATGYWLWLFPKVRRARSASDDAEIAA